MIAVYILLGILAFILLLLLMPIHGYVLYSSVNEELKVKVRYTFFPIYAYPKPEKSEKAKEKKAKKAKKKEQEKAKEEPGLPKIERMLREDGLVDTLSYLTDRAKLFGTTAKKLLKALVVKSLRVNVVVASEDAAQTALDYGRICAAVYPAEAVLECLTRVRHRSIAVNPDFLKEKGETDIRIHAKILPIRILWIAVIFIFGYIGQDTRREKEKEAEV